MPRRKGNQPLDRQSTLAFKCDSQATLDMREDPVASPNLVKVYALHLSTMFPWGWARGLRAQAELEPDAKRLKTTVKTEDVDGTQPAGLQALLQAGCSGSREQQAGQAPATAAGPTGADASASAGHSASAPPAAVADAGTVPAAGLPAGPAGAAAPVAGAVASAAPLPSGPAVPAPPAAVAAGGTVPAEAPASEPVGPAEAAAPVAADSRQAGAVASAVPLPSGPTAHQAGAPAPAALPALSSLDSLLEAQLEECQQRLDEQSSKRPARAKYMRFWRSVQPKANNTPPEVLTHVVSLKAGGTKRGSWTQLFEDWCQAEEKWTETCLFVSIKKTTKRSRKGELQWLNRQQLLDLYKDEGLVEELMHRKNQEGQSRAHPDFPLNDKMRLFRCFVVMKEIDEEAAEQTVELTMDNQLDSAGVMALKEQDWEAFSLEDSAGEPSQKGQQKKPRKPRKEMTDDEKTIKDGSRKVTELHRLIQNTSTLITEAGNNEGLKKALPGTAESVTSQLKKWNSTLSKHSDELKAAVNTADIKGIEKLLVVAAKSVEQHSICVASVKRLLPSSRPQPKEKAKAKAKAKSPAKA